MSQFRFSNILILAFSVTTQPASALTMVRPCNNSVVTPYNDLITNVNIVAQRDKDGNLSLKDPRGGITLRGPDLGMSREEIRQAWTSKFLVTCPGTKYGNRAQGEATLVVDSVHLLTVAHMFIDEKGRYREPLSECFRQSRLPPYAKVNLELTDGAYEVLSTKPYTEEGFGDLAFVRLKQPITDAKPYQLYSGRADIKPGQKMITVSGSHLGLKLPIPSAEPIVQRCEVIENLHRAGDPSLNVLNSDCTSMEGDSGGINLVRHGDDPHGELEIVGVIHGGGFPAQDHKPYKRVPGDTDNSFGLSSGISPTINEWFAQFAAKQKVQTAGGAGSTQPPARDRNL